MYLKILISLMLITLFGACSEKQSVDIKEGKWSIKTTTVIAGMPFQMPPMTITQCMSKKDIVPQQQNKQENGCEMVKQKINGSTVEWELSCKDSKSVGSITYKHDTFTGEVKAETSTPNGSMKMTSKMSGKYIGACE